MRRPGKPNSNSDNFPPMVPHGIYPAAGEDNWVAIACRSDDDWARLAAAIGAEWARDPALATFAARMARREEIDGRIGEWTAGQSRDTIEATVRTAGVPVGQVARPADRIDNDPRTAAWGLWPKVQHEEIGDLGELLDQIGPHLDAINEVFRPFQARRDCVLSISAVPTMASAWC